MHELIHLAASADPTGFGNLLGDVSASGAALASGYALLLGIRAKGRIKITKPDHAAYAGITVGTIWGYAGGSWAVLADSISSVPQSTFGSVSGVEQAGMGVTCLCIGLTIVGIGWKRLLMPALLGIALSVTAGEAGGGWGVAHQAISSGIVHVVGMMR